jgi:nitroreductase
VSIDRAAADALLTTTRSVRKRLDLTRPVPPELIEECIEIALQAPTGSNAQGWRWLLVEDPALRRGLAALYAKAAGAYLELARKNIPAGDQQTSRVYDSAFWLVDHLADVPVHAIPCISGRLPQDGNLMGASFYGSIFPAVWSFQLALRSRGLGSALTTLHLVHEREAAELLGIDFERVTQVALLPVGWTRGEFHPATRPAPESITHWNRWGS